MEPLYGSGSLVISHLANTIKSENLDCLSCLRCLQRTYLCMLCTAFTVKSSSVEECPPRSQVDLRD